MLKIKMIFFFIILSILLISCFKNKNNSDSTKKKENNNMKNRSIIIDHTCTDISKIPQQWIEKVQTMVLHHTGQSHGRQIPFGLQKLEKENPNYSQAQSKRGVPNEKGLKITRGQRSQYFSWEESIGIERYWNGKTGRKWTIRTLNYHKGQIDASLHTWCWHLRTYSEKQVDEYLSAIEILESKYPDVTFIYMTDTCDTNGDPGYNRWQRNEQIREYCRKNNKVLFDFADLEAWSQNGTEQNNYYHSGSGLNIPYWHNDWTKNNPPYYQEGHINEAACVNKAKAMWWLLARIAGWDGP